MEYLYGYINSNKKSDESKEFKFNNTSYYSLNDGIVYFDDGKTSCQADAKKGVNMFRMDSIDVPVLGMIENMAYFTPEELPDNKYYIFGKEGAKELAQNDPRLALIFIPRGAGRNQHGRCRRRPESSVICISTRGRHLGSAFAGATNTSLPGPSMRLTQALAISGGKERLLGLRPSR